MAERQRTIATEVEIEEGQVFADFFFFRVVEVWRRRVFLIEYQGRESRAWGRRQWRASEWRQGYTCYLNSWLALAVLTGFSGLLKG